MSRDISVHSIVERARLFATAAHAAVGQRRKYTNEPYIVHPAAVCKLVAGVDHTPEMLAAAWLHDVVEDTLIGNVMIRQEFGHAVAYLVYWLTDLPKSHGNREYRHAINRQRLSIAPDQAKTIKLADLIDNTLTIEARDPDFAARFRWEKRELLKIMKGGDPLLRYRVIEQIEEAPNVQQVS